jgi:hypothetical protein
MDGDGIYVKSHVCTHTGIVLTSKKQYNHGLSKGMILRGTNYTVSMLWDGALSIPTRTGRRSGASRIVCRPLPSG